MGQKTVVQVRGMVKKSTKKNENKIQKVAKKGLYFRTCPAPHCQLSRFNPGRQLSYPFDDHCALLLVNKLYMAVTFSSVIASVHRCRYCQSDQKSERHICSFSFRSRKLFKIKTRIWKQVLKRRCFFHEKENLI